MHRPQPYRACSRLISRNDLACNRGQLPLQLDTRESLHLVIWHLPKFFHACDGRRSMCRHRVLVVV
jgi:hypothetical protein